MKTRFVATAITAAMAACAGLAFAGPYQQVPYEPQPRPEVYIFGYGGVNFLDDLEANSAGGFAMEVSTEDGFGVGGGIGLRFPQLFGGSRLEVEGFYRKNHSEGIRPSNAAFGGTGDVGMNGAMLNFIKEFAWNGVVPYIGAGTGFGQTEHDLDFNAGSIHGDETSLNWQAIAGLEFPFWQRVSLFAEYHYMPVGDLQMTNVPTVGSAFQVDFDGSAAHSIFGGIRIYY